jgi:hypothetical protein
VEKTREQFVFHGRFENFSQMQTSRMKDYVDAAFPVPAALGTDVFAAAQ